VRGGFQSARGLEDSHALRLTSELADLRAANANPRLAGQGSVLFWLSLRHKKSTTAIALSNSPWEKDFFI